jgi:transposase, IS5 family
LRGIEDEKVQEKELKCVKTLARKRIKMYRKAREQETAPEKFQLPFEEKLALDNRWVIMTKMIPWSEFEAEYAAIFSSEIGAPAKTFRMALGALIIKEKLGVSDRETVEQIGENPYLQYFIGMSTR